MYHLHIENITAWCAHWTTSNTIYQQWSMRLRSAYIQKRNSSALIPSNYISNHEISRNIDVYNNDAYQVRVSNNVGCVTSAVQQYAIRVTLFMSQNLRCARVVSFFWQRACRSFFIRLILCCWLWSILLANLAFTPACGFDHACYLHDNVLLLLMMAVRTRLRYLIHSVYRVLRHQLFAYFIFQISTFIQCWTNILKLRAS
jgi:hypothetical protein